MSTASQSLRPMVDQLRRSWRASPMPAFFAWWADELRQLLPPSWRGWFSSGAEWYLLQNHGTAWTLRRSGAPATLAQWDNAVDAGEARAPAHVLETSLQAVAAEDRRLALLLPAEVVLRRLLTLPLAARDNLLQVVGFEMDRQTPFAMAQVYYAVRELDTPAAVGRFNVELVAVTRHALDPLLAQLRAQHIAVDAVDVAAADGRLGVNLLPPEQTPHRARPRRRLNLALAGACGLLLLGLALLWLHNRQVALEHMRSEVQSMRVEAQQVATLRQQLQDNAGAAGFLAQRKKNTTSMLSVLREVTTRLPDSTWLERLSVDSGGQVGFQGQSEQAATLLDALNDSRVLAGAAFQGSIQPDPTTGKERFYLTAQVQQAPPAGSKRAASPASAGSTP